MEKISYEVNSKENFYLLIKVVTSIIAYVFMGYGVKLLVDQPLPPGVMIILFYAGAIVLFLLLRIGFLIGNLKGNAVNINEHQFPDIYEIVKKQAAALNLSKVPKVFLLQSGGLLNAFATRFLGTNYIVIYSDVLEEAYENNLKSVEFIIGHELGHVKRRHMMKTMLLFPSFIIPFLNSAYSRACEYTCDNIGAALSPKGARSGLLLLAAGKRLYSKVNLERFSFQEKAEDGFWSWITEKFSSHPKLTKRVSRFKGPEFDTIVKKPVIKETSDHTSYLPKIDGVEVQI